MGWLKDKHPQKPKELTPQTTKFIAEQDGPPERELKARFVELLRQQPRVERAYLALAEHNDGTGAHVILALRCSCGEDASLIGNLADVFSSMFGAHEHLDIMFIQEDEERQLQAICAPFYRGRS